MRDSDIIRNLIRTGYPGPEPRYPVCPVCGEETDTFFENAWGDIVGCAECIISVDAWEEDDG